MKLFHDHRPTLLCQFLQGMALACLLMMSLLKVANAVETDSGQTCTGSFPNFVTDVCWSCMFPLRIAGLTMATINQEDVSFDESSNPVCGCTNPPRIGVPVSFWEPVRMLEVVKKPLCFPTLSGLSMPDPVGAPRGLRKGDENLGFYHMHWYKSPLMIILEVLLDYRTCLEEGSLDVAYMTELDPTWSDPDLAMILNPDVYLFANPVAQAACAADCVAATAGFPLSELYWCAGCQGTMYPLTGHISHAVGAVPSSALLMQRMSAKLHREMLVWGTYSQAGLCGPYPVPLMDKRAYKFQMLSPVSVAKDVNGRCCQPFGRAHQMWGLGKEIPFGQQDFTYLIFRKRNCCFDLGMLK